MSDRPQGVAQPSEGSQGQGSRGSGGGFAGAAPHDGSSTNGTGADQAGSIGAGQPGTDRRDIASVWSPDRYRELMNSQDVKTSIHLLQLAASYPGPEGMYFYRLFVFPEEAWFILNDALQALGSQDWIEAGLNAIKNGKEGDAPAEAIADFFATKEVLDGCSDEGQ